MTINYSTLLGLAEPVTGTESGTWGDDVNLGLTSYLDIAISGTLNVTADSDVTLTITNGSSAGSNIGSTTAQYAILTCTGTRTANRNINVPNSSKTYIVNNSTTGGYSITVRGVTGPTTGVSVTSGESVLIAWSTSANDFVLVSGSGGGGSGVSTFSAGSTGLSPSGASSGAVTLSGTLATTHGGTGLTSLSTGALPYGAGTSAYASLTIGTPGQILTVNSGGTAPQWTSVSGTGVTSFSAGSTGLTPNSASSGAITLAGTLATGYGGTGLTSFTSGGVVYASSSSALTTGSSLNYNGTALGVGTTPSSWTTPATQVLNASVWGYSNSAYVGANYYYSSGNRYFINSAYASEYKQTGGEHIWSNASYSAGSFTFTERMVLDTGGNLNIETLGAGIVFNNSSALTNSTLNDYETGTFTPTFAGTSIVYTNQVGSYTKIGRQVFFQLCLKITGGTASATPYISGLPFTSANLDNSSYSMFINLYDNNGAINYGTGRTNFCCEIPPNTSQLVILVQGSGYGSAYPSSISTSSLNLWLSGSYIASF